MPAGTRKFELDAGDSVIKALHVIENNQVFCGEASEVASAASKRIRLKEKCRRIIVTVGGPSEVWLSWKKDSTGSAGGRIMVSRYAPAEFLLEKPEKDFYVRRVLAFGEVTVSITGMF